MPIIWIILIILFVGVIVTLIQTKVPDTTLSPVFKTLILWAAVIGIILWLIYMFAPVDIMHMRVPRG